MHNVEWAKVTGNYIHAHSMRSLCEDLTHGSTESRLLLGISKILSYYIIV